MHLAITSEADWYAAPRRALLGHDDCPCGCGGACSDGLAGMGDLITPAQAVEQAIAAEGGHDLNPKDATGWLSPSNPAWANVLAAGQISSSAFSASCTGPTAPNVNLFATASGLALGTSAAGVGILSMIGPLAGTAAIPVLGVVIAGVGAIIAVVDVIFAHHASAVRLEQQLGCAAIAAFNNSVALIDQAVRAGQMKPSDAAGAMSTLYSKLAKYVAPSVSHSPYCSADCELLIEADAITIYRESLYAAMGAAQQSSSTAALPATSSGGAPVPVAQTVPGGGGTLVPMATGSGASQATTGTQVNLSTGAVVQPASAAAMPSWLGIAAAAAIAFVLFKG